MRGSRPAWTRRADFAPVRTRLATGARPVPTMIKAPWWWLTLDHGALVVADP